jgi:hypothetical protein
MMRRRTSVLRSAAALHWLICIIAVFSVAGQIVLADNDSHGPTVTGDNDLEFGTFYRNSSSTVGSNSSNAARFTVTGKRGKYVTLVVTASGMLGFGGSSNFPNRVMAPSLSTSACQYSTDGGSTWHSFSSASGGSVSVSTQFKNGSYYSSSTILVRVGGVLTSSVSQQRGTYYGSVTLHAEYD